MVSIKENRTQLNSSLTNKKDNHQLSSSLKKQEGKFFELPGAEIGKVIVRFPPEASGYLHIGHAKAALLNQYYAVAFKGQLIMRFDDTNPAKEKENFEKAILEDLELLQIKPNYFTHSSDYFDIMLDYCTKLLKEGKAYVDDTPAEAMKEQRDQKLKSINWNNSVDKNVELWEEMKKGTTKGQKCCVRAKIDYESANGCLRDPTIYRCKLEPHPRTETKYKVYPTYDFACPIVDSIEGVTHTLRTTEYHDRDDQFYWFIDALDLRRPYIWEYSRLNMTNTVLSKRKLTWFVDEGLVDGWDDPRFPTVRGILRRGMTVEGLKQFIIAQGSSRSVVFMEWDKIWAFNKKVIDPIAVRYTALNSDELVPVEVMDAKEECLIAQKHPKDVTIGTKKVYTNHTVFIEKADAGLLIEGQNTTFINWGNLLIMKIDKNNSSIVKVKAKLNLEDKNYKNTAKITWLSSKPEHLVTACYAVYFKHIINKPVLGKDDNFKDYIEEDTRKEVKLIGEQELKSVKKGEIIQLQRKGFFRCDVAYEPISKFSFKERPIILFHIPDGHATSSNADVSKAIENKVAVKSKTVKNNKEVNSKKGQGIEKLLESFNDTLLKLNQSKRIINEEKVMKHLIAAYEAATGENWTVICNNTQNISNNNKIIEEIQKQGDKIRQLKSEKAEKDVIDKEVKTLLSLKNDYKSATGEEWKPGANKEIVTTNIKTLNKDDVETGKLSAEIQKQGDKVRQLKSEKAAKDVIDKEIKTLLSLKNDYKSATGEEWKPGANKEIVTTNIKTLNKDDVETGKLSAEIQKQGDKVRQLKSEKAAKDVIDKEIKTLLSLKNDYKSATGEEWKPGANKEIVTTNIKTLNKDDVETGKLSAEIQKQGDKVRQLKSEKAAKDVIDKEIKTLLSLKNDYKSATGEEWKPGANKEIVTTNIKTLNKDDVETGKLSAEIQKQGDKVRQLKSEKAAKDVIDKEIKTLLSLKNDYKSATGEEWKPGANKEIVTTNIKTLNKDDVETGKLSVEIQKQGDKIRQLKSEKVAKDIIDKEVKTLLSLKNDYKSATGEEWKPTNSAKDIKTEKASERASNSGDKLSDSIKKQGDKIRYMKGEKAAKDLIDKEVKALLSLKTEYKMATGQEWKPSTDDSKQISDAKSNKKSVDAKSMLKAKKDFEKEVEAAKTGTRLGLEVKKHENFFEWYSQVITKSGMIEYYDVSGCYILRPWSFAIWRIIKKYIDDFITELGVQDCYFPIFVTRAVLEKEKAHIADFAPEVAWVTKCGDSDLAEPIAIRPTSETVMYPAYAKWLKSDSELPLRLNQWNNVVRWEFKDPKPFLRTREFLWQEGHTAFATKAEADEEVLVILDLYARVYEKLLAIPVVKGRKTEKEKFAGGDYTTTVEAFIDCSGRAIQGATSHHLGQNFSKMFNIQVEGASETDEKTFVYQNSWGLTTRTIGVMIMVHGDDKGLVLPPNIASIQGIIVPCGITANTTLEQRESLSKECNKLLEELNNDTNLRIKADFRSNRTPGWKFNNWELKGVPVRIELGPKDLEKNQVTFVRRDNSQRVAVGRTNVVEELHKLLADIQLSMLERARIKLNEHIVQLDKWDNFCSELNKKNLILSPFCGEPSCEDNIKTDSARQDAGEELGALSMGAKSLCIPFQQPKAATSLDKMKCIHPGCQKKPKFYTLFGRSY
ncbi:bifunctional glutamate/proline--tRNA ligase isoform X2 [Prorops nasuta]